MSRVFLSASAAALIAIAVCENPAAGASQAPAAVAQDAAGDPVDVAIRAIYNEDFAGAGRTIDAHLAANPLDALGYAARAVVLLLKEYDRLQVLQLEFFSDDDTLTDKKRLKPDPGSRAAIMVAVAEARRLADAVLAKAPADRRALFAMTMAVGAELQYASIVEKRYIRGGSLSMEAQGLAERALSLSPPIYDAYATLGSIEYVVASLNPFYRLVARMFGLRSGKAQAMEHLQTVIDKGRYYRPFAKLLMAALNLREGHLGQARSLMDELHREFPANTFYARELARLDARLAAGGR